MKYFYFEESPYMDTWDILAVKHEEFPFVMANIHSSFNVLPARLLGLSYAEYLRFCRDTLGAKIMGRNNKYPIAYFRSTPETQQFLKLLNKRAEMAMFEYNHPYEIEVDLNGKMRKVYDS